MTQIVRDNAQQIVDVVPLVMRTIRNRLRERRVADINVPQFRVLLYLNRNHGTSLSDLADHIGLTPPSMSKLIDGLVVRKLVSRGAYRGDRRRVSLSLTSQGRDKLNAAYACTQKFLIGKMSCLSEEDLKTIFRAMQVLQGLFVLEEEPAYPTSREMKIEALKTKQLTDRLITHRKWTAKE